MKIILKRNSDIFVQRLRSFITGERQTILFDLTLDGKSEMVFKIQDSGKYIFSYTRPLFFNPFKIQTFDYEYIFFIENNNEETLVKGILRLKRHVIGVLLLLGMILGYNAFTYIFEKDIFFWAFHVGLPAILVLYLLVEYVAFRQRIKKFLTDIES